MISWSDVIKLAIPFLLSIALIWIKGWYDQKTQREAYQSALLHILRDEIQSLGNAIDMLIDIFKAQGKGKLLLASFDVSTSIIQLTISLTSIDTRNSYYYSDLISSVSVLNKGISRLSELSLVCIKAEPEDNLERIDRAIKAQCKMLAFDFVEFGKAAKTVMDVLHINNKEINDQGMKLLQERFNETAAKLKSFN